ncbi:MAG TPA: PIN domain-containing protein [Thermoanaerobaculia bacterium]|nr:PIN domain-containing protein [Thermoanaerobaculia bacterium]
MIYLDASVALAQLFAEDRQPPEDLWSEPLTSSRLLQYQVWARVHARRLEARHGEQVRDLLGGVAYIELAPPVLARALEPFPVAVRTLDALHLATIDFLRGHGQAIELATYDARMLAAARALRIPTRKL